MVSQIQITKKKKLHYPLAILFTSNREKNIENPKARTNGLFVETGEPRFQPATHEKELVFYFPAPIV